MEEPTRTIFCLLHILVQLRAGFWKDPAVCLVAYFYPLAQKFPSSRGECTNLWAGAIRATSQSKWGMCMSNLTPSHHWKDADIRVPQSSLKHTHIVPYPRHQQDHRVLTQEFPGVAQSVQGSQGSMYTHGALFQPPAESMSTCVGLLGRSPEGLGTEGEHAQSLTPCCQQDLVGTQPRNSLD